MRSVFDYFKSAGLVRHGRVSVKDVDKLSITRIIDIANSITGKISKLSLPHSDSTTQYCASISLSGGRDICGHYDCRFTRLDSLSRFAALYGDSVYISNFFSNYHHLTAFDECDFKQALHDDLSLLFHIQPLILAGYITIVPFDGSICPNCIGRHFALGKSGGSRFKRAIKLLASDYARHTKLEAFFQHEMYHLDVSSSNPYLEHGVVFTTPEVPSFLRRHPSLLRRIVGGERVHLSESMYRESGINLRLANTVAQNIGFDVFTNKFTDAPLLTDRNVDVNFLRSLLPSPETDMRNTIAQNHLTTLVPFLGDISIRNLIALRKREAESFLRFRSSLKRCIDEFLKQSQPLSNKSAKQLYSDVIAPELARMDENVKAAKRDLVSSAFRTSIATVGAISFGIYTGLLPTELVKLAELIGVTNVGSDILQKVMALGDAEKTIRNNDLFYLWKVKRLKGKK